jgi:hypothetical protein
VVLDPRSLSLEISGRQALLGYFNIIYINCTLSLFPSPFCFKESIPNVEPRAAEDIQPGGIHNEWVFGYTYYRRYYMWGALSLHTASSWMEIKLRKKST